MSVFQKGFTLVEVLIAMAIVSILAAVAVPMYLDYVTQTQVMRAYREVSSVQNIVSIILSKGRQPTTASIAGVSEEYVGYDITQSNLISAFNITPGSNGIHTLVATLGDSVNTNVKGAQIVLTHKGAGVWDCKIYKNLAPGWQDKFAPTACLIL